MISVDRNRTVGGVQVRPNDEWFTKAQQLREQAIDDGSGHEIDNHYKHVEVKKALEEIFNDKCAFCEGKPTSQGPWEVEHYRPKGNVRENPNHNGYYWLAYTWENLLLSCRYCNGNYRDQPTFDEPWVLPAAGKHDQFPLLDEEERAMIPNDPIDDESPKLLNPCIDEDCETFFRFDPLGHILPEEETNERAKETINICNLDRRRLRKERSSLIPKIVKLIRAHERAVDLHDATLISILGSLINDFKDPNSEFSGTARFVDLNRHAFVSEE